MYQTQPNEVNPKVPSWDARRFRKLAQTADITLLGCLTTQAHSGPLLGCPQVTFRYMELWRSNRRCCILWCRSLSRIIACVGGVVG